MQNKVLVVEDERILAQNLKEFLAFKGLDVSLAFDGNSAIGLAQEFQPDVVVLDYRLPDMEGFKVMDVVREHSNCPFVLITGHPTSQVCDSAVQRGISHILFKPFPLIELVHVLEASLANQQANGDFVERRRNQAGSFPLQMYDGTWVVAERRHPEHSTLIVDDPSVKVKLQR